jgi:hypothetical protein
MRNFSDLIVRPSSPSLRRPVNGTSTLGFAASQLNDPAVFWYA